MLLTLFPDPIADKYKACQIGEIWSRMTLNVYNKINDSGSLYRVNYFNQLVEIGESLPYIYSDQCDTICI